MNPLNITHSSDGSIKLVAIHGLGSASTVWKMLREQFSSEVDFITLDLPGHGRSAMKATREMNPAKLAVIVKEELAANGIDEFHLTGNSLGGWVALEMGSAFPKSIHSLTALAPAGLWLAPQVKKSYKLDTTRLLAKSTYRFAAPLLKVKPIRSLGFQLVSPQWEKIPLEVCLDATVAMGSSTGYTKIWQAMLGNRFDKPIPEELPITVVFGDTDNTLPSANCQEKSLVPSHSEWIVLERSGHAPMWDQVETVAQLIKDRF